MKIKPSTDPKDQVYKLGLSFEEICVLQTLLCHCDSVHAPGTIATEMALDLSMVVTSEENLINSRIGRTNENAITLFRAGSGDETIIESVTDTLRRQNHNLCVEVDRLKTELSNAKEPTSRVRRAGELGEVWCWQGDGEDHLESITCPILITPEQLRKEALKS